MPERIKKSDFNEQKIEITLEDYNTNKNDNKSSLSSSLLKMTEIIITPSPSIKTTNTPDTSIQRINELYLPSPNKYKSSTSSSSNVSVSPKDNQIDNKITKSIIYSTESIDTSSSTSSNLINSSPSSSDKHNIPKYLQKNSNNNQDQLIHETKNILNYVGTITSNNNLQVNNNQPKQNDDTRPSPKIPNSPKFINSK